jgi:hypothetical protein
LNTDPGRWLVLAIPLATAIAAILVFWVQETRAKSKERRLQRAERERVLRQRAEGGAPPTDSLVTAEEMLLEVNRQMDEAMRGMDLRMSQAMQQANVSMERAMENMAQAMANSRLRARTGGTARHEGNLEVSGDLTVRGGNITITTGPDGPGNVVIRAGNATGIEREMRVTQLPSGGVSQTLVVPVPPEAPKPPPVSEKLPPTIYERLNQDDD